MGARIHEHSGRLGYGPLVVPVVVLPGTLLLALVYGYAVARLPLGGWVSPVLVVGYTLLLGAFVAELGWRAKVRNVGAMAAVGFGVGLLAVYAGWASFLAAHRRVPSEDYLALLVDPGRTWGLACALAPHGWSSILGWTPRAGLLWALWAAEAVVVIGGTTLAGIGAIADELFCEECGAWSVEVEPPVRLALPADLAALQPVIDGDDGSVTLLEALPPEAAEAPRHLRVERKRCPVCRGFGAMALRLVAVKVEGDGKTSEDAKELSPWYLADPETVERLTALGRRPPPELTEPPT